MHLRMQCLLVIALLLTACVSRKDPHDSGGASERKTVAEVARSRKELPLFHPDYKLGMPSHEYSESSEANLSIFAAKMKTVIAMEVYIWEPVFRVKKNAEDEASFDPLEDLPASDHWVVNSGVVYWRELYDDSPTIEAVRWAFSGNLMETRIPGTTMFFSRWKFYLADGTDFSFQEGGSFMMSPTPWLTWRILRFTPEMRSVLEPLETTARAHRDKLMDSGNSRSK